MPIRVLQPAAQVDTVMRDHLQQMAAEQGFRTRALAAAEPESLALAAPHPVFNLGLDQIGRRGALDRVAMTGWRYLIVAGDSVIASAEAQASGPAAKAAFSNTNEGVFVQSSAAALAAAEQWPEVKDGRFALGLLRVPALYVLALWLRDEEDGGGGDLFVPLAPSPLPLQAGERMPAAAFEAALQQLKRARSPRRGAAN